MKSRVKSLNVFRSGKSSEAQVVHAHPSIDKPGRLYVTVPCERLTRAEAKKLRDYLTKWLRVK